MDRPTEHQRTPEDTFAIHDVVVRYGFLVDDRDWVGLARLFTDDAVVDFRNREAQPPVGLSPISGRNEIIRQFRDVLVHPIQHMLVSVILDNVSADEVVARSKALFPTPGQGIANVLYRDVLVRTSVGWQIKHKSIKLYTDEAPAWSQEQFALLQSRGARFEGLE